MQKSDSPIVDLTKDQELYKSQLDSIIKNISLQDKSHVRSKKIRCEVWLLDDKGKRDKFLGGKWVKLGKREFEIKIGGVPMRFRINENEFKEHAKYLLYQVDVKNSVGAIRYHSYDKEKAYPNQVAIMLGDFAVRTFFKKGGMPYWYLLVPMVLALVLGIALSIVAPSYLNAEESAKQAIAIGEQLQAENLALKQQLASGG